MIFGFCFICDGEHIRRENKKRRGQISSPFSDYAGFTCSALPGLSQSAPRCPGSGRGYQFPRPSAEAAKSSWSEGPRPQIPTYLPCFFAARMAMESSAFTASLRSSNSSETTPESRSEAERQLRHVIRANGEAVEVLRGTALPAGR